MKENIKDEKIKKSVNTLSKYYYAIFNKRSTKVAYIFYISLIFSFLESVLINLSDIFLVRMSISLVFTIPMIILIFENDALFKVGSLFEIKMMTFLKAMIIMQKNIRFVEVIIFGFVFNVFQVKFIKGLYINDKFLGNEIENRKLFKVKSFCFDFSFLLYGYAINTLMLIYFLFRNKLSFFLFDDILFHPYTFYYGMFLYLSSRKLFKYLYKMSKSRYYFDMIKNLKLYLIGLIAIQVAVIFIIIERGNLISTIISLCLISIFIFTYEIFGIFTFCFMTLLYLIKSAFISYIESSFEVKYQQLIYSNTFYITISSLLSLVFIFALFYIEKDNLASTYSLIYQRVFIIKTVFDLWLMVNFIYQLFKRDSENYFENFYKIYHVVFLTFACNYIVVFFCVFLKLNVYVKESDVDFYFGNMVKYVAQEKEKVNALLYGNATPYFEIKFYKIIRGFFQHFNIENNKNAHSKALKMINRFVLVEIFFLFWFITNNWYIFFIIYFILIQFTQGSFNFIRKTIKFCYFLFFVPKQTNSNVIYEDLTKKLIKKSKYKLIYLFIYPYSIIIWKLLISKIILLLFEYLIAKFEFLIFGKLEPVSNVIYQFVRLSSQSGEFSILDIFILIICILPNTLGLLYCHLFNMEPNFLYKNYIVLNLLGIFFNSHKLILLIGVLNVFIVLNMFAADEDTYESFSLYFDLWGIDSGIY